MLSNVDQLLKDLSNIYGCSKSDNFNEIRSYVGCFLRTWDFIQGKEKLQFCPDASFEGIDPLLLERKFLSSDQYAKQSSVDDETKPKCFSETKIKDDSNCIPSSQSLLTPSKITNDESKKPSQLQIEKDVEAKHIEEPSCSISPVEFTCQQFRQLFLLMETDEMQKLQVTSLLNNLCYAIRNMSTSDVQDVLQVLTEDKIEGLIRYFVNGLIQRNNGNCGGILSLLRLLCTKCNHIREHLFRSNLPVILMVVIMYSSFVVTIISGCIHMLISMLPPCPSSSVPAHVMYVMEHFFLQHVINQLSEAKSNRKLCHFMAVLLISLYAMESVKDKVLSCILSKPSLESSKCIIEVAKTEGTGSCSWDLLCDLCLAEGNSGVFTASCLDDLLNLVADTLESLNPFNDEDNVCLILLEVLLYNPHMFERSCWVESAKKCLVNAHSIDCRVGIKKRIDMLLSDYHGIISNGMELNRGYMDIFTSSLPSDLNSEEVFISNHMYKETITFIDSVKSVKTLAEKNFFFRQSVQKALVRCHSSICRLQLRPIHSTQVFRDSFPHNLKHVHELLDSLNAIFKKVFLACTEHIQRVLIKIFIEIADVFPYVISHLLKLDVIHQLVQEMSNVLIQDEKLFKLCAVLFHRCFTLSSCLPPGILRHCTESFVRMLIDSVETRHESHTFIESCVNLILSLNIHCHRQVMMAFAHGRCCNTLRTILKYLRHAPTSNGHFEYHYLLTSIYADFLQRESTSRLIRNDCLKSIIAFSIGYLRIQPLIDSVPEVLRVALNNIVCNSLHIFHNHTSCLNALLHAVDVFGKKEVQSVDAIDALHQLRKEMENTSNHVACQCRSLSCSSFSNHDDVWDCTSPRGCLSLESCSL